MKTSNILFAWAIILATINTGIAQNTFKGKIINENQEPLFGVKIIFLNAYHTAITNANGEFEIKEIKSGNYQIEITSVGYEKITDSIQITRELNKNYTLKNRIYAADEVIVQSTRADNTTPATYTNLNKQTIQKINYGQDMPFIFNMSPSTVVTSDAGAGIGYTGIRIRGVDPTRTNVTINGIPANDAESHGTWWVNMPDFASSSQSIQIQRGVGTSANGAASFGASININTNEIQREAYAELNNSYGSFNSYKNTIKVGTGLINNKFTFDMRLSQIKSDGYIDRASADLKSYYISGAWLGKKSILRFNVFSGQEITYQAWAGTPHALLFGNSDSLTNHYYNNLGFLYKTTEDSLNLYNAGRTYNYYLYDNEVDNYKQSHYQLHFTNFFSDKINLSLSAHYTRGSGFYEQFRLQDDFTVYGLNPLILSSDTITSGDFIRRRWLDNHFYGTVFSLNYDNHKNFKITWGGSANQYLGKHFGEIIWTEFASNSDIRTKYYENDASKIELSSYVKATYSTKKIHAYADVQVRSIAYEFYGPAQVNGEIIETNQQVDYLFINPKAGVVYDVSSNSNLYLSLAMTNREPVRDDFVNSTPDSRPKHETMQNIEMGYHLRKTNLLLNANLFLMNYQNQLILTGAINDVGAYARTNVDQSYRAGLELEFGYKILKNLNITANATYSQNKVVAFTEYYDNYDLGVQTEVQHSKTDIAFSPNMISAGALEYSPIKNLTLTWTTKYVGKQFLDNTSNDYRKLNAYSLSNFDINYTIKTKLIKEINLGIQLNNILNKLYENNGYTYSYYWGSLITENFYYPQAGFNFMTRLNLRF